MAVERPKEFRTTPMSHPHQHVIFGERVTVIDFGAAKTRNEILLLARILLVVVYVVFGGSKLADYYGTVGAMAQLGAPIPPISALVAIVVECFGSVAIVLGVWTRPLAFLMAFYTLASALIGHHYWTMTGAVESVNEINFYKNVSIMGGFLALYAAGAGKYSLDAMLCAGSNQ
jgi:putative oxidoreductase